MMVDVMIVMVMLMIMMVIDTTDASLLDNDTFVE